MRRAGALLLFLAASVQSGTPRPESAEESWPGVLACLDDPIREDGRWDEKSWQKAWQCGRAAAVVIRRGGDADRERLWSVFDQLPEASMLRSHVIEEFLDWHVSRALEGLESAPAASAAPPAATSPLPERLQDAPLELQAAWRVYDGVAANRSRARPERPEGERIAFQSNEPAFQRVVARYLRGQKAPDETVDELTRFEWAGWCGTGSESLYKPQSQALLLAYLELGRRDLAAAVSGGIGAWTTVEGQAPAWDRRVLAASGVDWEQFHLGGVVAGQPALADEVAKHGSDLSAQQLVTAARFLGERRPTPEGFVPDPAGMFWALAALVEPNGSCTDQGSFNSREVERDPGAPAVSAAVQEGALEVLAGGVGPGAALDEADAASHLLARRCRPESREVFRAMLGSPYSEVRKRGALGLRGLGEQVAEPSPSGPVRFRLLIDGKPASGQEIAWTLKAGDFGGVSSQATADGQGVLGLQRDYFVDARRPVIGVVLTLPPLESAADPWFEVRLAPPADLDRLTTASVRLGSLTVLVPETDRGPSARRTVSLMADTARYASIPINQTVAEVPVVNGRVTFARLQHGRYTVQVGRPGGRAPSPAAVEVGDRPATVTLRDP